MSTIKNKLATFVLVTSLGVFGGLGVLTALLTVAFAVLPAGNLGDSTIATLVAGSCCVACFKVVGAIAEVLIDRR